MNADLSAILGGGLVTIVTLALVLYPTGRILRRMGFPPLAAIVVLIPPLNLVALWAVAFVDWPNAPHRRSSPADPGNSNALVP